MELEAEIASKKAAMEEAKASGMMPRIVQAADGTVAVHDGDSGELLGTGKDMPDAMRIASAHSAALSDRKSETVAYLATILEGGKEVLAMDKSGNARNSFELGTRYDELTAAAEDPAAIDQFQRQAALDEQIDGGSGEVSRVALGRNIGELRGQVRTFINRLFQGASVTTIVHEMGHGMLRELEAKGVIVRDEKVAFVKAVNELVKGQKLKRGSMAGASLALLPDGIADADITDDMLNEGISHIMEAEVLRTRKRAKADKAIQLSPGIISRNLLALSRLAPGATKKFRALMNAVSGVMGLSSARALAMRKGFREGKFDMEAHEAFLDKLTGRNLQGEHDAATMKNRGEILGNEADVADENNPFSLVPTVTQDLLSSPPVVADSSAFAGVEDRGELRKIGEMEYGKLVGETFTNRRDGRKFEFTLRQFKKPKSHSADPRIMKLVPSLPNPSFLRQRRKAYGTGETSPKALQYHSLFAQVFCAGKAAFQSMPSRW